MFRTPSNVLANLTLGTVIISVASIAPDVCGQTLEGKVPSVSPSLAARATWDSNAYYQIHKQRSYENLVLLFTVVNAYRRNPQLASGQAVADLNRLHADYQEKYREADGQYHFSNSPVNATQSALNLAGAYGGKYAALVKPLADEVLKWGVKFYEAREAPLKQLEAQRYLSATSSYSDTLGKYVDQAWLLAKDNPRAREAINTYFQSVFNAATTDTAETIKGKNRDYTTAVAADSLLSIRKTTAMTEAEVRQLAKENNKLLTQDLKKVNHHLDTILAKDQAWRDWQDGRIRNEYEKVQEDALYKIDIAGAKSTVFLIATLATFLHNDALARVISVSGNATIQVIEGLQTYNQSISIATTSFSKVATSMTLAASWVGAGLAIASILAPTHNADEIIISQLNAIRQQLNQLRQEMHERFDLVDYQLNNLSDMVLHQFDILLRLLQSQSSAIADLAKETTALNQQVLQLDLSLSDAEFRTLAQIRRSAAQPIDDQIDLCFMPVDAMTASTFRGCLRTIKRQGLNTKLDPFTDSNTDDKALFGASHSRSLDSSYPYITRIAGERFGVSAMQALQSPSMNPLEWSAAVDAFVAFTQKWPDLSINVPSSDIAELASAGAVLKEIETTSRSAEMYLPLLANYREKANALKIRLSAAEDEFARAKVNKRPFRTGEKIFVKSPIGAFQGTGIQSCAFGDEDFLVPTQRLSVPDKIQSLVPLEYQMSEAYGLTVLQVCYEIRKFRTDESQSVVKIDNHVELLVYSEAPSVRIIGFLRVPHPEKPGYTHFFVAFDREISSTKMIEWAYRFNRGDPDPTYIPIKPSLELGALDLWEKELKERFVNDSSSEFQGHMSVEDDDLNLVKGLLDREFNTLTKQFYVDVAAEMKTDRPVGVAVRDLDVAKSLLQTFLNLGFAAELEHDDAFRSLAFGRDAIPGGQDVLGSFLDVFALPAAARNKQALRELKWANVTPSADALKLAVQTSNYDVVRQLLILGYWEQLNQVERAELVKMADDLNLKGRSDDAVRIAHELVRFRDGKFYEQFSHSEVIRFHEPYKLIGPDLDTRLAQLSDRIKAYQVQPGPTVSPVIDDTLGRLKLFSAFYGKPVLGQQ